MRLNIRKGTALVALALLAATAVPAMAINYSVNSGWEMFTCWADVPAPDPAFGFGGTTPDGNTPYNDPFTFTLGSQGVFKITDVFEPGDYFRIFDWGTEVAMTPVTTWSFGSITSDPDVAFGDPNLSFAAYLLNPGSYSVQFQDVFFAGGPTSVPPGPDLVADAYFRVDTVQPIPEPASLLLVGLGLGVAGLVMRRRARA
jgi:hypothetical protein